jgi:hypothetical protein
LCNIPEISTPMQRGEGVEIGAVVDDMLDGDVFAGRPGEEGRRVTLSAAAGSSVETAAGAWCERGAAALPARECCTISDTRPDHLSTARASPANPSQTLE